MELVGRRPQHGTEVLQLPGDPGDAARRLGAQVKAYDVRPETREQVESLGAQFITLKSAIDGAGQGGYARALTPQEQAAQQEELNTSVGNVQMDLKK
jgi:NAD/NADP transhydrogenase alpha subunit